MSVFTPRYILVPKGGMKRKMNTRKRKALSPVVASIILIAVTVAVSIAVAAWMGALTFNFMATEQLKITNVQFPAGNVVITTQNTGTTPVTMTEIHVNNRAANLIPSAYVTLPGKQSERDDSRIRVDPGFSVRDRNEIIEGQPIHVHCNST